MSTTPPPIQPNTYRAILADPPWDLYQKGKFGASKHYDLLDLESIKRLGKAVDYAAAEKSYLFLWVTTATVPAGLEVLEAWGFRYTSYYFWAKPRMTLGNTFRNAGELLLLGTRGKANKFNYRSQPNWGIYPVQGHSHKPEEIHLMIERVVGPGKYLELFARRPAPSRRKWDVWGNEVASTVSLKEFGFEVPSDHQRSAGSELPESSEIPEPEAQSSSPSTKEPSSDPDKEEA